MQMAATGGMRSSPGRGRRPLAQSPATLPAVSAPSSVVRSMHRMARSSAQSLDALLIDRPASDAARSSTPTWSTERTPRSSEPRWASETETAMGSIIRPPGDARSPGGRWPLPAAALEAVQAVDRAAAGGHERDLCEPSAAVADHVVHDARRASRAVRLAPGVATLPAPARFVLQALGRVELLLTRREDEVLPAVTARQQPV